MRFKNASVTSCVILLCIGGFFVLRQQMAAPTPERIQYRSHHPRDAAAENSAKRLEMKFSKPSTELTHIPETKVSKEFDPDELISISGALEIEPKEGLEALLASFVEHTKNGDVTAQSVVIGPPYDPTDIELLINAPKKPGKYSLLIEWAGAKNYISRAEVVVRPKPPTK